MRQHETFLRIKAAEDGDGERILHCWATTPSQDLAGDIVDPQGAEYELPLPLLAYHQHDKPVGVVESATISERGIRVRARLTRGVRLADELWQLIKDGAIRAVSIGFQALKSKPLPSGGSLFESWRWLELSLTPVPCNPDATIVSVGKMLAYGRMSNPRPTIPATPAAPSSTLNPILAAQANALEIGGNESDALEAAIRAAAKMLPPEVADLVDVGRSSFDPLGKTFCLVNRLGTELATVTRGGEMKLAPGVLEPTSKATEKGLTAAQRAEVGEMLVQLSQIITKAGLTPLRERVARLEGKSSE